MMIEHERGCKCDEQREPRDAAPAAVTPASPKHIFIVLSREDVSGENNEAAHSKRRVDADHYPRDPPLEDTCGK